MDAFDIAAISGYSCQVESSFDARCEAYDLVVTFEKIGYVDDRRGGRVRPFAIGLHFECRSYRVHVGVAYGLRDGLAAVCGYVDDRQHFQEERVRRAFDPVDRLQIYLLAAVVAAGGGFSIAGADQDVPSEDRVGDLEIPFVLNLMYGE